MVFWPKLYSISKKHPEFPKKLIFILEKGTFCFEKLFPARTRLEWRSALFFGPKISVLGQRIQFLPYDPKFGQRPVGSTVRYEMMKMCIGSVKDTLRRWQLVLDDTLSAEGIYAFINCTKWRSVQVLPMPYSLTHSLTNLKDSATQLLIKYKSGALTTQWLQKMPMIAIYLKNTGRN